MLIDLKLFHSMKYVDHVFKGGYICGLNTADSILARAVGNNGNYTYELSYFYLGELNSYGVVDSPEQFSKKFAALLENDPRSFTVFFTHIEKEIDNKGKGGGWRWHKWGPYEGEGQPQCEHLDDEDEFADGIYVYHIYIVNEIEKCCVCYFDLDCKDLFYTRFPAKNIEDAQKSMNDSQIRLKELKYEGTIGPIVML